MEIEPLSVRRCSAFVAFCMKHDLQVLANRREGAGLLRSTLAVDGDTQTIEWSSDKYDKLLTFFSQNDAQVHYAGADRTVGVYAVVKLLGELRRRLRDYPDQSQIDLGMPLMSPRPSYRPDSPEASTGRGVVPSLDFASAGLGQSRSTSVPVTGPAMASSKKE